MAKVETNVPQQQEVEPSLVAREVARQCVLICHGKEFVVYFQIDAIRSL